MYPRRCAAVRCAGKSHSRMMSASVRRWPTRLFIALVKCNLPQTISKWPHGTAAALILTFLKKTLAFDRSLRYNYVARLREKRTGTPKGVPVKGKRHLRRVSLWRRASTGEVDARCLSGSSAEIVLRCRCKQVNQVQNGCAG